MRERSRSRRSESSPLQKPTDEPAFEASPGLYNVPHVGHAFSQISVLPAPVAPQPKLSVSTPGDAYEQEADRVAEQVVRMSDPSPAAMPMAQSANRLSLQAAPPQGGAPVVTPQVAADVAALHGGGQPLDTGTRAFMEPRFDHDFSKVRVHADTRAAETAWPINALAFTVGHDIAFAPGQYAPETAQGQRLIAHELVHVLQTNAASQPGTGTQAVIRRQPMPSETQQAPVGDIAQDNQEQPIENNLTERDADPKKVSRSYAVVVPQDRYGQNALAFIHKNHPKHKVLRPSSFEELFDMLRRDIQAEAAHQRHLHIDQLVLVTHANRKGGMKIPLRRTDVGKPEGVFTPENLDELRTEIIEQGKNVHLEESRHLVVTQAIDDQTEIIVRGCEFGQDADAPDALRLFFGGKATVWAPTDFQGYGPTKSGDPSSYYVHGYDN